MYDLALVREILSQILTAARELSTDFRSGLNGLGHCEAAACTPPNPLNPFPRIH